MSEEIKTIVVDIRGTAGIGRQVYAADGWSPRGDGGLDVTRKDGPLDVAVAAYAPGQWMSVRTGDALAPVHDANAAALGIATWALRDILAEIREIGEGDTTLDKARLLAEHALEDIDAETGA